MRAKMSPPMLFFQHELATFQSRVLRLQFGGLLFPHARKVRRIRATLPASPWGEAAPDAECQPAHSPKAQRAYGEEGVEPMIGHHALETLGVLALWAMSPEFIGNHRGG
jgi:hypothetical protein